MHKHRTFLAAVLFSAALLLWLSPAALAAETGDGPETLPCAEVPLYVDGVYVGTGILTEAAALVPLRTFTEAMLGQDCQVCWDADSGTATLTADQLEITLTPEDGYLVANGRYIYLQGQVYNINGTIVVPIRELARVFGVEIVWNHQEHRVDIDTAEFCLLEPGDDFYPEEDLYWLSHVIYSESGNQPLEGMIGVGNVVLNRAADDSGNFGKGTVKSVIFLPGQFDVVPTGAIYMTPSDAAVAAAKLCLEGYNTVGDAKWFVNPAIGATHWFRTHATLAVTIQDHDFYA